MSHTRLSDLLSAIGVDKNAAIRAIFSANGGCMSLEKLAAKCIEAGVFTPAEIQAWIMEAVEEAVREALAEG